MTLGMQASLPLGLVFIAKLIANFNFKFNFEDEIALFQICSVNLPNQRSSFEAKH